MKLRASQIETLGAVDVPCREPPIEVAARLSLSERAAKARLDRLSEKGLIDQRYEGGGVYTYRLTDKGRRALEEQP